MQICMHLHNNKNIEDIDLKFHIFPPSLPTRLSNIVPVVIILKCIFNNQFLPNLNFGKALEGGAVLAPASTT